MDKFDLTKAHDSSCDLVAVPFLLIGETNDVKGAVCVLQLLVVINRSNSHFALRNILIVVDVVGQQAFWLQIRDERLQKLVENMVRPFNFLLLSDA